jgi:hypothetical protein
LGDSNLENRICAEGESYAPLRSAVQTLLIQNYLALQLAVKYVGGQYTERSHKGDPGGNLPLTPVAPADQRKALDFLIENAFSADAFAISPGLLNKLQDNKLRDWQNRLFAQGRRFDFPLTNWAAAIQNAVLSNLLQPMLLQRVVDAEYKVDNPFRLSALFRSLTREIWLDHPTPTGKTAVMQRNLQRIYLSKLISMITKPYPGTPDEAIALARLNLRRIRSSANTVLQKQGLSDEVNAHLLESIARIDRALEAKMEAAF